MLFYELIEQIIKAVGLSKVARVEKNIHLVSHLSSVDDCFSRIDGAGFVGKCVVMPIRHKESRHWSEYAFQVVYTTDLSTPSGVWVASGVVAFRKKWHGTDIDTTQTKDKFIQGVENYLNV